MDTQIETGPLVGAQVWVERDHSGEELDRILAAMAAAGMRIARVFVMWKYVEPRKDEWDFGVYDAAFEAAQRHGIKVAATLTAASPPGFRGEPFITHGMVVAKTREQLVEGDQYIKRVVQRYRQHPALYAWIIMNEPGQAAEATPLAVEEFRGWVKRKYESVEKLNAAWLSGFGSFEEVVPANVNSGWGRYEHFVEWRRFYRHFLAWHTKYLADSVARHDAKTPVHVNPHGLLYNPAGANLDLPLLASTADSLGGSCHPAWHFTEEVQRHSEVGVGMVCDLLRPAAGGKPFWVTELQGGTCEFSGWRPMCPTGAQIERWTWEAVFSGAKAVVYWLWNQRREGQEAGEWGLTNLLGEGTERSEAASRVAKVIAEHREIFDLAKPQAARAAVLVDLDTQTMLLRQAGVGGMSADAGMEAMFRYVRALRRLGVAVDVVTIGSEVAAALDRYALIVAPNLVAISDDTAGALRSAVERGAHVWADGLLGLRDPWGRLGSPGPRELVEVAGARLAEFRKLSQRETVRVCGVPVSAEGTVVLMANDSAEEIARWRGMTCGVTKSSGAGRLTWVGLMLGGGEAEASVAQVAALLWPWVKGVADEVVARTAANVLVRRMTAGEGELVLVVNAGQGPQRVGGVEGAKVLAASDGSDLGMVGGGGWVVAVR